MARTKHPLRQKYNYRLSISDKKCSTCENMTYTKKTLSRYHCDFMNIPCESNGVCDEFEISAKTKECINGAEKTIPDHYKPCKCKVVYADKQFRCKQDEHYYHKYYERGSRVLLFTSKYKTGLRYLTSMTKFRFKDHFEVIK